MMLAGAALAAISVALPPRAAGSDIIVLALGALAAVLGVTLIRWRERIPEWLLGLAIAAGTVLITVATAEGGVARGTADNEMLYVFACVLAFSFLRFGHAIAQLAFVAAAYAILLISEGGAVGDAITRWLISMAALLVAGVFVYRLRRDREVLVAELSQRARHDPLTGILNRAALEERAALELARARRDDAPISLLALDVDGFKELNDSRGHPAGDLVLRRIAATLSRETRQVDAIARVGGDEFAVLLPGASTDDAIVVAQRLRDAGDGAAPLSIGVASGSPEDGHFETLWARADAAMYEAKRSGGGRVAAARTMD